ncbi:hypothetical protein EDB84DRAFT_1511952, partial [Lactarius hengduanensis]
RGKRAQEAVKQLVNIYMIIPAYSIPPANVTKNHVLEVIPHLLILIHPDWLITLLIWLIPTQADTYFKKACTA